jgi:endonuclease/exonuclease/phosphatase family metal-dependent hydrolase
MRTVKIILIIITIALSAVIAFLILATFTDYKPKKMEMLAKYPESDLLNDTIELNAITWNIGYAGLGNNMDFFYDGGKRTRDSKQRTVQNLKAIVNQLKILSKTDFILLQEVDRNSKRSYYIDQYDTLTHCLTNYYPFFGKNYMVPFVPVPLLRPMGKVVSGIAILSHYLPTNTYRNQYPGSFSWPKNLFMLDRCFLVSRFRLRRGKDLVLINTHNSAFDQKGTLKKEEMESLRKFVLSEYQSGNYIVAGGDWNQCPPKLQPRFKNFDKTNATYIASNFLPPDWKYNYVDSIPTNRSVVSNYNPELTPVTVIDFFVTSPNVTVKKVKTLPLHFENSDHHPVMITFTFENK